ncbi:MAG: sirohydrochlorin cobaltochelatase [Eubacterium sp.]|nr:sirohydrochlorin cobaltochelatase [Eubacterium sp.]
MENNKNGNKAILAVSFGTSYADSRDAAIGGIERALAAAFPAWEVRRAFTSGFIIKKIFRETGEKIDTVTEALERAESDGIRELLVQPTHFMKGIEYDEMQEVLEQYQDRFERLMTAEPLLASEDDFRVTAEAVAAGTREWSGRMCGDLPENNSGRQAETTGVQTEGASGISVDEKHAEPDPATAYILMGHGTSKANANTVYETMQRTFADGGLADYYIATVEASPTIEDVMEKIKEKGYRRIVLRPMMVVAGDHACNDMAGSEPDSWKSILEKAGYEVTAVLHGLGEDPAIQEIYVSHARAAMQ